MENKQNKIKYQQAVEELKSRGLIIKDYDLYIHSQKKNLALALMICFICVVTFALFGYIMGYQEGLVKGFALAITRGFN